MLAFAGRSDARTDAPSRFQNLFGALLLSIFSDMTDNSTRQTRGMDVDTDDRPATPSPDAFTVANMSLSEQAMTAMPVFDAPSDLFLDQSHQALQSLLRANEPQFAELMYYAASPSSQNLLDSGWAFAQQEN